MSKKSLVNEWVTVQMKGRSEHIWTDVRLDHLDPLGATFSYTSRGADHVYWVPTSEISYILAKSEAATTTDKQE